MYEIDPKFRNPDGSINYQAGLAAGRKARAQAAGEVLRGVRRAVNHSVQVAVATLGSLTESAVSYVSRRHRAP